MKIVALAMNDAKFDRSSPIVFIKGDEKTISFHEDKVWIPSYASLMWPEVEFLCRLSRDLYMAENAEEAANAIGLITIGNDFTCLPDLMPPADVHLPTAKSFKGACGIGKSWFSVQEYWEIVGNNPDTWMTVYVNGVMAQNGSYHNLRLELFDGLAYASKYIPFTVGDMFLSGTVAHRHYSLKSGDYVEAKIEGFGELVTEIE